MTIFIFIKHFDSCIKIKFSLTIQSTQKKKIRILIFVPYGKYRRNTR
ncbi:hypothetical protein ACFP3I_15100 [Chryseobacterium arachidis]